ncbi:hypothetical protein RRG08_047391 [Elysia crispata]|uniref:Uncharacterized protein n=1 Tax=Elysia crispata TaxID=231223 RepID=A0AAE1CRJ8_9GAST|nr:hypothetical protein RRG08_047391 [Elysia crispata]
MTATSSHMRMSGYESPKDSLDSGYESPKDSLDSGYESPKDSLDSGYESPKDSLDSEPSVLNDMRIATQRSRDLPHDVKRYLVMSGVEAAL